MAQAELIFTQFLGHHHFFTYLHKQPAITRNNWTALQTLFSICQKLPGFTFHSPFALLNFEATKNHIKGINNLSDIIRIGIIGYGNLGKGAEKAIAQNPDMTLAAVFTRRPPHSISTAAKVYSFSEIEAFKDSIDVMLLCGGSATDLPEQTREVCRLFNTVDSYDNHAKIPGYFAQVDETAKKNNRLCLISTGWDPGLFSLYRLYSESILPAGKTYTFWGEGLSQGHSDALRRVEGVKNGVQYTIPKKEALEQIRTGKRPELSNADRHKRVCYVVAEEGADKTEIASKIKSLPDYFAGYDTEVQFISEEELLKNHAAMPHGGKVLRSGETGDGRNQQMEFGLKLESNPEFTASVLTACARAVYRLARAGKTGAITVFDVPPGSLSPKTPEELRKELL